ncbi:MAG: 3-phosphoshikimate 1-carboxyvinyltransferase [Flavobacteriaceae bacterium]|jgi:3-phosphoshikimate 1-carboxyvinyltransferase|nr:3-phosphoshikimate 1-carboxyvinyltransferase [Flavobacteriaceae bacterium]
MENSLFLKKSKGRISGEIFITGSKSESNRLLILNKLFGNPIRLKNLSNSKDTEVLQTALESNSEQIDIHHAGTAMRFLTAFYSIQNGKEVILTGSSRMKERPIGILVDALKSLGAKISYLEKEGFPPLKITGKSIEKNYVELNADISSQFVTALILIAPKLPDGLTLKLNGKITSTPYLEMTLEILRKTGIKASRIGNKIRIEPLETMNPQEFTIESDWSSASYFYSLAALSEDTGIRIHSFFENSLQGDAQVSKIYKEYFGVETQFEKSSIYLKKIKHSTPNFIELNLNSTPDIAQTIAVTCAGLKVKAKFTGLETLKIKETDRLIALENEFRKLGVQTRSTHDSFELIDFYEVNSIPKIKTYQDHRMAMSFAPMALVRDLEIENPEVVEKSYPDFWRDLNCVGIISK